MTKINGHTVKRLGGNLFEVVGAGEYAGTVVLVSYSTPVAYKTTMQDETVCERTSTRFSRSTETHLNRWARYSGTVDQAEMDRLLRDMTGDARLNLPTSASREGREQNTRGVRGHTEPGDANLVVPVYRRSYR